MKTSPRVKTNYPNLAWKAGLVKAGVILGLSCLLLGQELQRQGDARTLKLNDQHFISVFGQRELTHTKLQTTPKRKPVPVPLGTVARRVREQRDEQCHGRNMEGKRCAVRIVNDEGDQN